MCGIWARLGCNRDPVNPKIWVDQLKARGPEGTKIIDVNDVITFGFTRLAINGLTKAGMQPFQKGHLTWMCNGEIYNSKELEQSLGMSNTGSDCECIGELYMRHRDNVSAFVRALDGVFAIALALSRSGLRVNTSDCISRESAISGKVSFNILLNVFASIFCEALAID